MAVLRMDLEGQSAPEPRPPSNSSDSSEHSGDQRGPSPDLSTFDLADEVGIQAAAKRDANNAVRFLTASESARLFLLQAFGSDSFRMYDFKVRARQELKAA